MSSEVPGNVTGRPTPEILQAFESDGYEVVAQLEYQGMRGFKAQSKTATNYETKVHKPVYYVEGSAYQMGYLTGLLANNEVEQMAHQFMYSIIPAFFNPSMEKNTYEWFWKLVIDWIEKLDQDMKKTIPQSLLDEMQGVVDGCKAVNPESTIEFNDIFTLNVGIDFLLSIAYNVSGLWTKIPGIKKEDITMPFFCNAFAVFGEGTADGSCYFGRDFMFATADIFQDAACMILYNPLNGDEAAMRLPIVSVTAPGMVGSITSMNSKGIGMGVDMAPAGNNNHENPGFNSILLVRHTGHVGTSAEAALQAVVDAERGVTWIYPIADGINNRALMIEAGFKTDSLNYLDFPPDDLKNEGLLPDQDFLNKYDPQKDLMGLMARWNDYQYPAIFLDWNEELFKKYKKSFSVEMFAPEGFINKTFKDTNCPEGYYFAPQREEKPDLVIATNMFIEPSMRLCGMDPWTNMVAGAHMNEVQWRYDTLNQMLLDSYGSITEKMARETIDFLAPSGKFPEYYAHNIPSSDGKTVQINGATSLCNLTKQWITSHYGYFADEWISMTLPNYI